MEPGILRDVLTVIAGVATGVMSGAFGVGGTVISTPAIRLLGCSAALAVGTTLPSILPGVVTGSWRYRSGDYIRWRVVTFTAPAGIIGAVTGAWVSPRVPGEGHLLMILTALILMWSAVNMMRSSEQRQTADGLNTTRPTDLPAIFTGAGAGVLSGLLGVGGGIVMVPLFRRWLGLPIKNAFATSLICVGCFAIPGTIVHSLEGGIDWRFASWLTVGVVVGAPFGSNVTMKMSDKKLQRVFGFFLALIAVVYGVGEFLAL